jgi:tartrate-resistant acid phosphatase type 5
VETHDVRFLITVGDNIYKGSPSGITNGNSNGNDSGEDDDDWFFTFFQPYRFIINRIPIFAAIGNHDASETPGEGKDDRDELYDNLFMVHRFNFPVGHGPGLFYNFRFGSEIEFICLDSSKEEGVTERQGGRSRNSHVFKDYRHRSFVDEALRSGVLQRPKWRIPYFHHAPYSRGDDHGDNNDIISVYANRFKDAGIRACFSGHTHTCQWLEKDSVNYFISGGGGRDWSGLSGSSSALFKAGNGNLGNFLIVKISMATNTMEVIPYTTADSGGRLQRLPLYSDPRRRRVFTGDITVVI